MKERVVLSLVLLAALCATHDVVLAQSAILRTGAIDHTTYSDGLPQVRDAANWSFHYNDNGVLDSLSFGSHRQLGGLDKMKPFVTEMYDWESLPPSGNFYYNIFADLRLVLTEPEPGKIVIYQSELYSADSAGPQRKIEYWYDTASGRVTRFGGYNYDYEDSAGYLIRIRQRSSRHTEAIWNIIRDSNGTITLIDHLTSGMRRDTLRLRTRYQIIKWALHRAENSVRTRPGFGDAFDRFPWLPEGEPVEWIASRRTLEGMGPGRHITKVFDSLRRLIRETEDDREDCFIEYDGSGVARLKRYITKGKMELEIRLANRTIVNGSVWIDSIVSQRGEWKFGHSSSTIKYEYAYRHSDSLLGDRFAPHLIINRQGDKIITLSIRQPLAIDGVMAYLIDANETEIGQIPIKGRETSYVLPEHSRQTPLAIRWKYRGRKIVDHVL